MVSSTSLKARPRTIPIPVSIFLLALLVLFLYISSSVISFWRLAFSILMEKPSVGRVIVCLLSPLLSMVVIPVFVVRSVGIGRAFSRFDYIFWKLL